MPGRRPVTLALVSPPPTLWIFEPPWRMSYDVMPSSFSGALQVSSAPFEPSCLPRSFTGCAGAFLSSAVTAGVVTGFSSLRGERFPAASLARTENE